MNPDFDRLLIGGIGFGLLTLTLVGWRFGAARTGVFVVVAGLFPAIMDFISSFAVSNYEYPGQTRSWVFTYIFFGWIGVCATCLLLAEGILARPDEDLLCAPRLRWQAPLLAGLAAVLLDLFIDPVAVAAGFWVWSSPVGVYYGIPLLNFVGWFVLMALAPVAWIEIARRASWSAGRMLLASFMSLPLLCVASILLSLLINNTLDLFGIQ
jgi:uncharacterized membrane protein